MDVIEHVVPIRLQDTVGLSAQCIKVGNSYEETVRRTDQIEVAIIQILKIGGI